MSSRRRLTGSTPRRGPPPRTSPRVGHDQPPRRRRGAVVAAVLVAAIIVATSGGGSSSASADSPSTSTATTLIKRQDLVETDTESGTLGYADSRAVINHLTGTVTWVPAEGDVVHPDHALYKVDASPVILMNGSTRRTARSAAPPAARGRDVAQLEHDLRALGYDPGHDIKVDGDWTSATTARSSAGRRAHGFTQDGFDRTRPPRLPARLAARRIRQRDARRVPQRLGRRASGGGCGDAAPRPRRHGHRLDRRRDHRGRRRGATWSPVTRAGRSPSRQATTTRRPGTPTRRGADDSARTGATGPTTPRPAEQLPPRRRRNGAAATTARAARSRSARPARRRRRQWRRRRRGTAAATASNTVMTTTSNRKVVTVDLATTKSSLAKVGARVGVELPSGRTVHGRITDVGKVATSASSSSTGVVDELEGHDQGDDQPVRRRDDARSGAGHRHVRAEPREGRARDPRDRAARAAGRHVRGRGRPGRRRAPARPRHPGQLHERLRRDHGRRAWSPACA